MFFTIVVFILTLLVLVVIHEAGHYFVAKKFNIKVLEFGFGIPPRAWGKKIGETIYSLNWLPIGGFVRLLGEDEVDKKILDNDRSFAAQNVYKRIAVVIAGVVMNFLLAFLLFYIVLGFSDFKSQILYNGKYDFVGANQQVEPLIYVHQVMANTPAQTAGLKAGDRIIGINSQEITSGKNFTDQIKQHAGKQISLTISDENKQNQKIVQITPRQNPPAGQGALGIGLNSAEIANISYDTPLQKIFSGPIHSWNVIAYSGITLSELIGKSFQEKNADAISSTVAGPVGITNVANQILNETENPIIPYLSFMALISLNLAVFNLLPFPALDGGRLFFLYIEALTRKKVRPEIERWVHTVGMAILLILSVLITYADIKKLL